MKTADTPEFKEWAAELDSPGETLLNDVERFLTRFIAFPSDAARIAVTLWAAHAHLVDASENSPRLALLSPEPGSGKTRALEILELLVPNPMHVLSASPAAVFRTIEAEKPTLLMDEVDTVFTRRGSDDGSEDLRGLLNAGHRRGATIPRVVVPGYSVKRFPVYAAVALAGLGDLPDTLMSRSVIIRMRRRAPGEKVEPYRRRIHGPAGEDLRDRIADWFGPMREHIRDAWPVMPPGVEDRPADVWEPLLAVADAAGGRWPDAARAACVDLVKVAESRDASLGVRLLADLKAVFGDKRVLRTTEILDALLKLDESPWADLHGKPLDDRGLARRLKPYGVSSRLVRSPSMSGQGRGYQASELRDAWTRYLPPVPEQASQASQPSRHAGNGPDLSVTDPPASVTESGYPSQNSGDSRSAVTDVTLVTLLQGRGRCPDGYADNQHPDLCQCQHFTDKETDR